MTSLDRPSTFLSTSLDEAVALCHETRAYFGRLYQRDCQDLSGQDRLIAGRAAMRLTVTVTQVLAMLMAYKTRECFDGTLALLPSFTIAGSGTHGRSEPDLLRKDGTKLPIKLCELLDRGDGLYQRIARIEAAAARRH